MNDKCDHKWPSQTLTERGCVVLDQPQHVGERDAWIFSHTGIITKLLRLVSDTAALRPPAHFQSHS